MGKYIKVCVTRSVQSSTAIGIKSEETFRFPLDKEKHQLEMMELSMGFQVLSFNDDLSTATIATDCGEVEYDKNAYRNCCITVIPPRFRFFVDFELVEEDYKSNELEGYELIIKETCFRGDTCFSREKSEEYVLPVKVGEMVHLSLIEANLTVAAIDEAKRRVRLAIGKEEVEVSGEEDGTYHRGGQSGYNDSFEVWSNDVIIKLKKK